MYAQVWNRDLSIVKSVISTFRAGLRQCIEKSSSKELSITRTNCAASSQEGWVVAFSLVFSLIHRNKREKSDTPQLLELTEQITLRRFSNFRESLPCRVCHLQYLLSNLHEVRITRVPVFIQARMIGRQSHVQAPLDYCRFLVHNL